MTLAHAMEVWGGVECTLNRVGDEYHDQFVMGGHAGRLSDLDEVAALGIKVLRYPVLWESVARDGRLDQARWRWSDERIHHLQALKIDPIIGLTHHGSGPSNTNLLDPEYASGLAAFAGACARRYPWVKRYTPVNEPLTTARFSALYGLWYPHEKSTFALVRALLNQCRATVLAMREIRVVNPWAELVQTEDLGRTSSTWGLTCQADFENHRRWLTWDLLCGRIDQTHPLWGFLRRHGATAQELRWFGVNVCPPDIIGINHYVTSNRFLDERSESYPEHCRGGNDRKSYADVEAVRVLPQQTAEWLPLIEETWQRYRLPLALTEVHIGCSREEQMRWLYQAWSEATTARAKGVDLRAITPWALFGSHDWSSLLTKFPGHYEPGAWDVRGPTPRRTALAGLIAHLADQREPQLALLRQPGWWQRPSRLLTNAALAQGTYRPGADRSAQESRTSSERPIAIVGATGTLGQALSRMCEERGRTHQLLSREDMDIGEASSIEQAIDRIQPAAVINAAGYVRVDDAEADPERCERENSTGPGKLASACALLGLPLVTFSSDLVFDGQNSSPYDENDVVAPLSVYGQTKARGEQSVLQAHPGALVIRTSAFFGPWDEYNFLSRTLRSLASGETVEAPEDVFISPTYVPDLAGATLDLLVDGASGLWHVINAGSMSWVDFARMAAEQANISVERLHGVPQDSLNLPARRPRYSVLTSTRGFLLPPLADAVSRYIKATAWKSAA